AHVPGLARHGSKPSRELPRNTGVLEQFLGSLRSFDEAVAYLPHQAYIGAIHPRALPARPWVGAGPAASRFTPGGEIMPEEEFLGLLACLDQFGLVTLDHEVADLAAAALVRHPLAMQLDPDRLGAASGDAAGVVAGALVASGVFRNVAVVGGGSLPKLGMKFQGHLRNGLPVLEDVVGGSAALVTTDDGVSPVVRLDGVGRHRVRAGSSNPQIME